MREYAGYRNCLCWQKTKGDTDIGQCHPLGFFDIWDKKELFGSYSFFEISYRSLVSVNQMFLSVAECPGESWFSVFWKILQFEDIGFLVFYSYHDIWKFDIFVFSRCAILFDYLVAIELVDGFLNLRKVCSAALFQFLIV